MNNNEQIQYIQPLNLTESPEFRCPECGSTEYTDRIKTKVGDEFVYEFYCSDCHYIHEY